MAIGRPRVELREFDQTASVEGVTIFPAAFVGFAKSGPINVPTLITNKQQFEQVFGPIGWDPNYESKMYLGYALDFFLDVGNYALVVRADASAGESLYAYCDVASAGAGSASGLASGSVSAGFTHGKAASEISATSASATPPTTAALSIYSKYKSEDYNTNYRFVVLNRVFFSGAATCASAGSGMSGYYAMPKLATQPVNNDEFYLAVYSSAGTLLEEYMGSLLVSRKNTKGDSIFIEEIVNNTSQYITVKANAAIASGSSVTLAQAPVSISFSEFNSAVVASAWTVASLATSSVGGSACQLLSGKYALSGCQESDMSTSLDTLVNENNYTVRGICAPGATGSTVQTKIKTVVEGRMDCVGFVDFPRASVTDNLVTRVTGGINSTYMAGYSNWFKYYDGRNGRYIWLPPTIQALRAVAKTWRDYAPWWAPAGKTRGTLVDLADLDYKYTDGDLDVLAMNQINPLTRLKNEGNVIWGQKCLYNLSSDLRDLNVRYTFITIEQAVATFARNLIFEFNDALTRAFAKIQIEGYLATVKDARGIVEYTVVCDTSNNTDAIIAANELVIDCYIKANKVAEVIKLNFTATRDAVNIIRG